MHIGVAQTVWDWTTQLVVRQIESPQAGEVAQFWRNRPAQLVSVQKERMRVGEAAQFWRNRPAQPVRGQIEVHNTPVRNGYSMPIAYRGRHKPVAMVGPACPVGTLIQRD